MQKFKINIVNINQKAGDATNRDHPDYDPRVIPGSDTWGPCWLSGKISTGKHCRCETPLKGWKNDPYCRNLNELEDDDEEGLRNNEQDQEVMERIRIVELSPEEIDEVITDERDEVVLDEVVLDEVVPDEVVLDEVVLDEVVPDERDEERDDEIVTEERDGVTETSRPKEEIEIEDLERRRLVSNSPFRNRPSQKPSSQTTKTEQNMDTNRLTSIRIEKNLTDLTTEITKAKSELSTFGRKIYNALFGNPTPPKDIEPIVPRIVELEAKHKEDIDALSDRDTRNEVRNAKLNERVKETERIASETVEWSNEADDRIKETERIASETVEWSNEADDRIKEIERIASDTVKWSNEADEHIVRIMDKAQENTTLLEDVKQKNKDDLTDLRTNLTAQVTGAKLETTTLGEKIYNILFGKSEPEDTEPIIPKIVTLEQKHTEDIDALSDRDKRNEFKIIELDERVTENERKTDETVILTKGIDEWEREVDKKINNNTKGVTELEEKIGKLKGYTNQKIGGIYDRIRTESEERKEKIKNLNKRIGNEERVRKGNQGKINIYTLEALKLINNKIIELDEKINKISKLRKLLGL